MKIKCIYYDRKRDEKKRKGKKRGEENGTANRMNEQTENKIMIRYIQILIATSQSHSCIYKSITFFISMRKNEKIYRYCTECV